MTERIEDILSEMGGYKLEIELDGRLSNKPYMGLDTSTKKVFLCVPILSEDNTSYEVKLAIVKEARESVLKKDYKPYGDKLYPLVLNGVKYNY